MGLTRALAAATRASGWRMMKLRAPRAADMLLYSWLVVVVLIRFTQNCALAVREITRGALLPGTAITEFDMLHLLFVAFLLTFLSSTLSLGAATLDRRRLSLSAVPAFSLAGAELAALAARPMTWVACAFAVPAAIPLLVLPHPAGSVTALAALVLAGVLAGAAAGHALALSRLARRAAGAFRLVFTGALLVLVTANFDFDWKQGPVRIFLFQHPVLLDDGSGGGALAVIRAWSPSAWVLKARAAACASLAAAALVAHGLAARGTPSSGPELPGRGARHERVIPSSGSVGRLIYRHHLGLLVSGIAGVGSAASCLAAAAWLFSVGTPVIGIPILGCVIAYFAGYPAVSNMFGHDGQALRRYALLCPEWRAVFLAKSMAWISLEAAGLAVAAAATAVRVSPAAAGSLVLSAAAVLSLTLPWGALSSQVFPSAAGSRQGPAFASQAAPFALCAVPLGVHTSVAPFLTPGYALAMAGVTAAGIILYAAILRRVGKTFDSEVEAILDRF